MRFDKLVPSQELKYFKQCFKVLNKNEPSIQSCTTEQLIRLKLNKTEEELFNDVLRLPILLPFL